MKRGPWSEEEDKILIDANRSIGNEWTDICKAVEIPGRTLKSIRDRWATLGLKSKCSDAIAALLVTHSPYFSSSSSSRVALRNTGAPKQRVEKCFWTKAEDEILLKAVLEHKGEKWSEIAKYVPGRNGDQCVKRWYDFVNPDINHGPWSDKEDAILLAAHERLGDKWVAISRELPGRTQLAIRNRWRSLIGRGKKESVIHARFTIANSPPQPRPCSNH